MGKMPRSRMISNSARIARAMRACQHQWQGPIEPTLLSDKQTVWYLVSCPMCRGKKALATAEEAAALIFAPIGGGGDA